MLIEIQNFNKHGIKSYTESVLNHGGTFHWLMQPYNNLYKW